MQILCPFFGINRLSADKEHAGIQKELIFIHSMAQRAKRKNISVSV